MTKYRVEPVDQEIRFSDSEIIVSKTDLKGKLTYVNDVFVRVAEMSTAEVLDQPHSVIRHPDMPRVVFKLLWETISAGKEIFAYVKNMSKSGKYYWVLAHVTPSFDDQDQIIGYHSNRRLPSRNGVEEASALYLSLLREEQQHSNAKIGMEASYAMFTDMLTRRSQSYSQFVWSLGS